MTYLQQLRDSLTTEHHHVPLIYNPPELEMEYEHNGENSMMVIFNNSIKEHLSDIPEYQCRICEDPIPHEFSESHIEYGSIFLNGIELLSEHTYGCCQSCTKKIANRKMERDGSWVSDPNGPIPTNQELQNKSDWLSDKEENLKDINKYKVEYYDGFDDCDDFL